MPGTIFVTGGSGFVGQAVIEELLARGYSINALVHHKPLAGPADRLRSVVGDLSDARALDEAMAGCEAAIHLVGIIAEKPVTGATYERIHHLGTRAVVDAALRNEVRRFIHMSALGVRADAISDYHKTKFAAEEYLRQSGLDWTIFRPSMIHGPKGELMRMEQRWARRTAPPFLFMPYFGRGFFGLGGAGSLQPVYVKDVAKAFVDALEKPKTIGEVYLLGGPDRLTWPELHQACAKAFVGKRRWVMALPVWKAKLLTYLVPRALLPFNRDQVIMSQEENTCDPTKFTHDFGWEPRGFVEMLETYKGEMR